jgi:hypothetical protein
MKPQNKEQVRKMKPQNKEQVRKRGLPPPLLGWEERGQAPLPDLFYFSVPDLSLFFVMFPTLQCLL